MIDVNNRYEYINGDGQKSSVDINNEVDEIYSLLEVQLNKWGSNE